MTRPDFSSSGVSQLHVVLILFSRFNVSRYNDYMSSMHPQCRTVGPDLRRGKPSRTTEFQIVEKGIPHWNQRTKVSRFRRRRQPSDVSLQKSKGNSVRATRRSSASNFPATTFNL